MGLYDTVRCLMPLPVEWRDNSSFQTKSLGCGMNLYTITPTGALIKRGDPPYKEGNEGFSIADMRIPIDGSFELYDLDRDRGILRLRATFVVGHCRRIEMVDWSPYPGRPNQMPPQAYSESSDAAL